MPPSFLPPCIPMPDQPRVPTQEPPRVVSPSPPTPARPASASLAWSPPPKPAGSTLLLPTPAYSLFQATPRQLNFTGAPSPHLPIPPPSIPTREPIFHRAHTRAPAPPPPALFTTGRPLHERIKYQMSTAKTIWSPVKPVGFAGLCRAMPPTEVAGFANLCQSLSMLDIPVALSVLDPSTGEFLKHCQLCWDPRYKATMEYFIRQ